MRAVALVLVCLACASHARTPQTTSEGMQRLQELSELQALTKLLLASSQALAFNPHGAGGISALSNSHSNFARSRKATFMQDQVAGGDAGGPAPAERTAEEVEGETSQQAPDPKKQIVATLISAAQLVGYGVIGYILTDIISNPNPADR
mmetsp:Transcript_33681/g.62866  ORF Transcript_33681/g.62866 Transcript_33681/m.62866 type:complete len:149 (-) Transcript_33681:131-577(-)